MECLVCSYVAGWLTRGHMRDELQYIIFEVPSNLIIKKLAPSTWLSLIMVLWGKWHTPLHDAFAMLLSGWYKEIDLIKIYNRDRYHRPRARDECVRSRGLPVRARHLRGRCVSG